MNNKRSGVLYLPSFRLCPFSPRVCLLPADIFTCPKAKKIKKFRGWRSSCDDWHKANSIIHKCPHQGIKMLPEVHNLFEVINQIYKVNALPEICNQCRKKEKALQNDI